MAETMQQLVRERADDNGPAVLAGERSWTWREHVAAASAHAAAVTGLLREGVVGPPAARRRPARQLAGDARGDGRGRARRLRAGGAQHHAAGPGAAGRRPAGRLPAAPRRRRAPGAARRARPRRGPRGRRRRLGARRRADPAQGGRAARHLHDDLHLGHQRRAEGRAGLALHGADGRGDAGRAVLDHPRRRLLRVDAAVPLQRRGGGLGGRGRGRRGGRAGPVLGVRVPRRRAPPRRHLRQLRRQAAGLRARHRGAARRRRQPAAGGVRQRGERSRHRRVLAPVRLRGVGRVRLHRERRHRHPAARHPARLDRPGDGGGRRLRQRHGHRVPARPVRRAREAAQRRRGGR